MRVRKNVYTLSANDQTLYWYGRAVTAMKALPSTDVKNWNYQASIHGTPNNVPSWLRDFWAQCQHGTSFFLPWHRMYLLYFEQIVAEQIVALGGPRDWALPYWNYSAKPEWTILPSPFRDRSSPLFVEQRVGAANAGDSVLQPRDIDLHASMNAPGNTSSTGFFGGVDPGHSHRAFGQLEGTVHNNVHNKLGGATGWMGDPDLAARDPIFWLHHANIDRLWEVWLQRDASHQNLTSAYWLSGVTFYFHNALGGAVSMRTFQVLNAASLGYGYDDTSDPIARGAVAAAAAAPPPSATAMPQPPAPELVGATGEPVVLDAQIQHVAVPTPVPPHVFRSSMPGAAPVAALASQPPSQLVQQVVLQLENVTSAGHAPIYDVYVGIPDAGTPSGHEDKFVGRASMFGIVQASDPLGAHGGGGQNFAFDITGLYHQLADAGQIDPQNLRVSFVPVGGDANQQVRVGRISLYFS
jgi:tyrosinase